MTIKDSNKEVPFSEGVQFNKSHFNSYASECRVPEPVQDEIDLLQYTGMIGDLFYHNSEAGKRKPIKDYKLLDTTPSEIEASEKQSLLMHLQPKPNPLRYTSLFKVILIFSVVVLGMIGEVFIYQSIGENAFELPLIKSYFIGLLVLLFTKFVQFAIHPNVKAWLKENNLKFKSIFKVLVFVFASIILLNAVMMGITNLKNIERQKKIEQMEYISRSIDEAEWGEDTAELEAELNKIQTDLNEDESGFFTIAKYISIALLGLLTIGAGATLFAVGDLYNDALKIQKRIQKLRDKQADFQANFHYYLTTYGHLLSLQKEIMRMYGAKHFLEKLLSKRKETALKVPRQ